jgi:tetratricopeptide (TPR) repeat protein
MDRSLRVQVSPATLLWRGGARDAIGDRDGALGDYEQALPIARDVGDRAGEATTLNNMGSVHWARGDLPAALDHYQQALPIRRDVGDRAGEAATLNNIGSVHQALGDQQGALNLYQQALPIVRDVGNRAGESATRYNIAMVLREQDHLGEAVNELELVVALDHAVQHPDLDADTAILHQVQAELTAGERDR